jgi:hypothetical protein
MLIIAHFIFDRVHTQPRIKCTFSENALSTNCFVMMVLSYWYFDFPKYPELGVDAPPPNMAHVMGDCTIIRAGRGFRNTKIKCR